MPIRPILTIRHKTEETKLRKKTKEFDFAGLTKSETRTLIATMRDTMRAARGVGLSANQIGVNTSVCVLQVGNKFYAIFNPKIVKRSAEETEMEEGCLSVPGVYGVIRRANHVMVTGYNQNGKKLRMKAWGLLAQALQHEVDHLNGALFTDNATRLFEAPQENAGKK